MTIKQHGGVFGRNPKFNSVEAESLSIAGNAVPDASTILVDGDIGSTVQGYDADTAKLDATQTFTAAQTFNENIVMANTKGIDFSATGDGSGTASSELFDDYEEGSFTIGVTCGGTDESASNVYTEYTKVGNKVTVNARFTVSSFSGTGTVSFALPYAVTSNANHYMVVPIGGNKLSHPGDTPAVSLTPGATSASLFGIINSTASSGASITDANFSSGTQVRASFTYLTD